NWAKTWVEALNAHISRTTLCYHHYNFVQESLMGCTLIVKYTFPVLLELKVENFSLIILIFLQNLFDKQQNFSLIVLKYPYIYPVLIIN
ncbi:hypothetical protein, partial [Acinetobacter baumannii]|uniref:hypothetical protein n=1 Tax=Acinetobacter baumannii TaxID=470 RepID=UPI001C0685D8